jgi:hypothetical protein
MKSVIATHSVPHERFVLQFDGRAKSGYRRVADALRAALRLKDEFPQHDIKVRATGRSSPQERCGRAFNAQLIWGSLPKGYSVRFFIDDWRICDQPS